MKRGSALPVSASASPHSVAVAVVGAGIGGLAAALLLSRDGHDVTLFDRFAEPQPVGSGLMLQQSGLSVLRQLGLADQVLSKGRKIDRFYGLAERRGGKFSPVLDIRFEHLAPLAEGTPCFALGIQRAALFETLFEAVQTSSVRFEANREIASLNDPRLQPFDLVVNASGARSSLVDRPARPLSYGALWATVDWPSDPAFTATWLEQRYRGARQMVGLMPIGTRAHDDAAKGAFFWSLKASDVDRWRSTPLDVWKAEVLALWPAMHSVLDQFDCHDQLTFAAYQHRTLSNPIDLSGPNLVHIGDAFHSTSPQLGQGANMALLDAAVLAYCLSKSARLEQSLRGFARSRRFHIALYQTMSYVFTPLYQSDHWLPPLFRNWAVAPTSRLPGFRWLYPKIATGLLGFPSESRRN